MGSRRDKWSKITGIGLFGMACFLAGQVYEKIKIHNPNEINNSQQEVHASTVDPSVNKTDTLESKVESIKEKFETIDNFSVDENGYSIEGIKNGVKFKYMREFGKTIYDRKICLTLGKDTLEEIELSDYDDTHQCVEQDNIVDCLTQKNRRGYIREKTYQFINPKDREVQEKKNKILDKATILFQDFQESLKKEIGAAEKIWDEKYNPQEEVSPHKDLLDYHLRKWGK